MVSDFQNEIIAGVAVVFLIATYILLKKKSSKKETEPVVEDKKELEEIKVPEVKPFQREAPPEIKQEEIVLGSEEGDFGEQEEETPKEIDSDKTKSKTLKKRDVPAHGKITKQNFKEFAGQRILVAEDNLINQKVLTGLLADTGIDVVIANDGQEALDILKRDDDFLMILMDAHMPRMDGFEATRNIRQNPKYDHILVVALSGDTAADDIEKMRQAGMSEQLEKPLRIDSFYDIMYAYTGEQDDDDNDSDDYIEVIMTKELNGDKGLEVCGGDEEFYREILLEFERNYADSYERLNSYLNNGELDKADKLLLDIIGVSANIGAQQLEDISKVIKEALKDKEEKSYLTLSDPYKVHLNALLKDIKDYLSN